MPGTLLVGTASTGLATEVTIPAGRIGAGHFVGGTSGTLEQLIFGTGPTANTCTSCVVGIMTREGQIPGGVEPAIIGSFWRPGFSIAEVVVPGTPAINSTLIGNLLAEIDAGVNYWIAVCPIGGALHLKTGNTTDDLGLSVAGGFSSLAHTLEWEWPKAEGPLEVAGNGTATSPSKSGAGWLGLMGHRFFSTLGAVNDFTKHGILFDRGNELEPAAGAQATGTAASVAAGMTPIIIIEDGEGEGVLPNTSAAIEAYAKAFVETVNKERAAFPGATLYFTIMNEPYFRTETAGVTRAKQYANIVAEVLARCEAAGIPLSLILVEGRGQEWITEMYAAQPTLKTKIGGWSLHPYGGVAGAGAINWNSAGIQSIQALRAEMQSGQGNIFVTEFGWWVENVNGAKVKEPPEAASQAQAKEWLTTALGKAWRYHAAGWLKAMVIYSRGAGGWALEEPASKMTGSGEALTAFADTQVAVTAPPQTPHVVSRQAAFRSSYR